jgi:hypothetical protein
MMGRKCQGDPSGGGSPARKAPLEERVCISEWLTAKIQDVRERGRPGRPLGSASALAGALPWRARGAEPLPCPFSSKKMRSTVTAPEARR